MNNGGLKIGIVYPLPKKIIGNYGSEIIIPLDKISPVQQRMREIRFDAMFKCSEYRFQRYMEKRNGGGHLNDI